MDELLVADGGEERDRGRRERAEEVVSAADEWGHVPAGRPARGQCGRGARSCLGTASARAFELDRAWALVQATPDVPDEPGPVAHVAEDE
jgi:hypothetical protein